MALPLVGFRVNNKIEDFKLTLLETIRRFLLDNISAWGQLEASGLVVKIKTRNNIFESIQS